jgi:CheY-like chemotaxis protein
MIFSLYIHRSAMVGEERSSTKCRVLVVEDDAVSCHAMRALLTRWGYEVQSCSTTAGALDEITRHRPQCLILDLMLSDANGITVLREIRRREMPIHVAVVTALQDPQIMRDVRDLKPDVVIGKPVDLAVLKRWLLEVDHHSAD